jgi:hypothetical protein
MAQESQAAIGEPNIGEPQPLQWSFQRRLFDWGSSVSSSAAYHPERFVAFEAARYVVTDKQPHTQAT